MSGWDAWLPQITGVGFAGGLLISADGAFLAATPGYVATAAECASLANKFKKPDTWSATPTTFQGQKYLALACNDHTAEFKMGSKGASGFKTARGTIVFCFYNENCAAVTSPAAAGGLAARVEGVFSGNGL